jgi:hypothetical protein
MKKCRMAIDPENRSIEDILVAIYNKFLGLDDPTSFRLEEIDESTLEDVDTFL